MPLPSPYSPGARPAYLAGRARERALVDEGLARVRLLKRSAGPLLAFHGPRGLGKTSLLRQAQQDAEAAGFVTGWVTGRSDQTMIEAVAKSLTRSVQQRSLGERASGLLHRLDSAQVEFGIPGIARVSADLKNPRPGDSRAVDNGTPGAAAALGDLLEDVGRFAANHDHYGLVLFVDEFQEAMLSDRKSLLIALQEFDGTPPSPVAIVAAGLPSIHAAVTDAATFGERTRFVEISSLNDVAVAEALQQPAHDLGVTWTNQALEHAIDLARGYPHTVQLVGEATWNAARPEAGDHIDIGHVRLGQDDVHARMRDLFHSRWVRTTPEHRRVLAAIAAGGDDSATRADIASRLGVTSNALSRPREELISRGLIEPLDHGAVRFTIPGFGDFVRAQPPA